MPTIPELFTDDSLTKMTPREREQALADAHVDTVMKIAGEAGDLGYTPEEAAPFFDAAAKAYDVASQKLAILPPEPVKDTTLAGWILAPAQTFIAQLLFRPAPNTLHTIAALPSAAGEFTAYGAGLDDGKTLVWDPRLDEARRRYKDLIGAFPEDAILKYKQSLMANAPSAEYADAFINVPNIDLQPEFATAFPREKQAWDRVRMEYLDATGMELPESMPDSAYRPITAFDKQYAAMVS